MANEADVFMLDIDGDARAYPRYLMTVPYIAGDIIVGKNLVMTYCILSVSTTHVMGLESACSKEIFFAIGKNY